MDEEVDIRNPLPYQSGSVHFIFAEHLVEHVTFREAYCFFEECFRVLSPGGIIRIVAPSLELISANADDEYRQWLKQEGWGDGSRKSAIRSIIFNHRHQSAWTQGGLIAVLDSVGFVCEASRPDWSRHPELNGVDGHSKAIGRKMNHLESVAVEGIKPL